MNDKIKTAFTLVELLVVIAIIGILSGLIIVGMSSSTNSARIAKAQIFSASLRDSLLMSLVSEWKFDSISGTVNSAVANGVLVVDTWGNNNGTISGGTTGPILRSDTNCINGQCLQFDGTDDYVDCGNGLNLSMATNSFSIELWIKASYDGNFRYFISKKATSGGLDAGYQIYFRNSSPWVNFLCSDGVDTVGATSTINPRDGNWHHIAAVLTYGVDAKFYLDGVLSSTNSASAVGSLSNATNFYIGRNENSYINGSMDQVRIYNNAIPSSLIKENYYIGINKMLAKREMTKAEYESKIR